MRLIRTGLALTVLLVSVYASSAQSETTPEPEATPEVVAVNLNPMNLVGTDAVTFVQFTNTVSDVPAVDLYVPELGDSPLVTDLAFGEVTDFYFLPAGALTVDARTAGADANSDVLASLNWGFPPDTSWMALFAGMASNLSLQVEPINLLRNDIPDDVARVRVINVLANGPVVSLASSAGDDFGTGLAWNGVADADVAPGNYTLTLSGEDGTSLLEAMPVDLPGGALTTLVLLGVRDGAPPVQIVSTTSPAYRSRVQFVNRMDAPLQFFLRPGDVELLASLAPGETSDFIELPSGAVTYVVYAPGTGPTGQELGAWIGAAQPLRDQIVTFGADGSASESEPVFSPAVVEAPAG